MAMMGGFSHNTAINWLREKFPSFETSQSASIGLEGKSEPDYFISATLLGYVTKLPEKAGADAVNKPLLVAAVKMKGVITERTSRSIQFNFAKRVLRDAVNYGAPGLSGLPSQGLFFFHDNSGNFRLSLVTGEVEGRRFKFNEAKRQSFYIEPDAANNIVRRRFYDDIKTFADLKEVFSVEKLTKEFYRRLFDWYAWAMDSGVIFPNVLNAPKDPKKESEYTNEAIIRLITRLMFTWFIRQKNLVPAELFDKEALSGILKSFKLDSMNEDNYYRAILQNLFFATFNTPQDSGGRIARRWINAKTDEKGNGVGLSNDYNVATVYRYKDEFRNPDAFLAMMKKVPFLNCALFDCLDKVEEDGGRRLYFDGFSTKKARQAHVPNGLFFGNGDDGRLGIITLFSEYEFTIDENDADDADVSLDPELLGKVFENLLGAYNPETKETARKATGSFYTPREIVDYMVEESLKSYIRGKLKLDDGDKRLDDLFDKAKAAERAPTGFTRDEEKAILDALYLAKIIDPACGSGAFPMGVLHTMIRLMKRLDADNTSIRGHLLERYKADMSANDPTETKEEREERLEELEKRLEEGRHYPDYERKLYLIENCIYGVDIQPIAAQISKLRFFISLLCDQFRTSYDLEKENYGLLSLPNLEAKFVCANTLIALPDTASELDLTVGDVHRLREELVRNRHRIFGARSTKRKEKYKAKDKEIRRAIKAAVVNGLAKPDEKKIALLESQIEKARKRRKEVEKPDWQEVEKPVQQEFFASTALQPMMIKIDRNADKRDEIDREIRDCERAIEKERGKEAKANLSAAQDYANLVAGWDPFDQNASSPFFDPKWMFNIADGFDVVIGNPPYGVVNKRQNKSESITVSDAELRYYKTEPSFKEGRGRGLLNIYRLFVQKSLRLLAHRGILSEIFPLAFAGDLSAAELRRFVFSGYRVISFDAFPERDNPQKRVFEAAKTSVCILVAQNMPPNGDLILRINNDKFVNTNGECFCLPCEMLLKLDPGYMRLPIVQRTAYQIFMKMRCNAMPLKTMTRCRDGEMSMTSDKSSFSTDSVLPEMIRGAGIGRYVVHEKLSQGEHLYIDENRVTDIETVRNLKAQKRIAMQAITGVNERRRIKATLISNVYCANSVNYIIGLPNMKFTLGLLNSQLLNFFFAKFSTNSNVNGYEIDELPLILNENSKHEGIIVGLVDRILAAKKKDPQADTSVLEAEIDKLVYKLYGITDEKEIALIEGRNVCDGKGAGNGGRGATALPDVRGDSRGAGGHAGRVTLPKRRRNDDDEMLD